jgi:hypothetical protein
MRAEQPRFSHCYTALILVPEIGFEPIHPCERCDLNTVRLPISPPGRVGKGTINYLPNKISSMHF